MKETMNLRIKKILLIDDDDDDFFILKDGLKNVDANIGIDYISSCDHLAKQLEGLPPPDLILLDLNMPVYDGKSCLKIIKSLKGFNDVPVVMYSTSNSSIDVDECYEAGANFYLIKPASFTLLIALLKQILVTDFSQVPDRDRFVIEHRS